MAWMGNVIMSKLIVLRGNSGSGKTTVSKILQEKFGRNTMLISHDMVRMQILHAKDVEALPLIMQLLKYGRQNSDITILEGILPTEVYMPLFEMAVQEYGKDIFAFYYDLPFEETLRRHETKPNKADFGEQDMRRWWKENDFIHIIPEKIKNCIDKDHNVECFGSVHGHTDTLYCHTCGATEIAVNEETYPCEMEEALAKEAKDQYEIKNTTDVPTSILEQVAIEYSEGTGMTIGEYMQYMIDAINRSKKADKSDPYYQCPYCLHGIDCPDKHVGK